MCTYSAVVAWLTAVATVQQVVALHLLSRSGNLGLLQPMCRPWHAFQGLHSRLLSSINCAAVLAYCSTESQCTG
jgi:hypothetical protein